MHDFTRLLSQVEALTPKYQMIAFHAADASETPSALHALVDGGRLKILR
jgi:hypothetical protein